jgi:hypothetical protein
VSSVALFVDNGARCEGSVVQLRATQAPHVSEDRFVSRGPVVASDFYTNLRRQIDSDSGSLFNPAEREELVSLLTERDELITLLARSDPGSIERLYRIYATYSRVTGK